MRDALGVTLHQHRVALLHFAGDDDLPVLGGGAQCRACDTDLVALWRTCNVLVQVTEPASI